MNEGFFDHFFYWIFVIASLLTAIDWWIGPNGRAAARERMGHWWLHMTETSFAGLVAEDARRVESWLRSVFGRRWLGLRALLLCTGISLAVSVILMLVYWTLVFIQFENSSVENRNVRLGVWMILGYEVTVDDIIVDPEEEEFLEPDELSRLKEQWLLELNEVATVGRPALSQAFSNILIPLILLNAFFDWISLGVSLLLLGMMGRSVTALRLGGLVALDLVVAVILAALVVILVGSFAIGPREFVETWILNFDQQMELIDRVFVVYQRAIAEFDLWEGVFVFPALVLFTCALPSLLHLALAIVFLGSKLFRPVLQPVIGRLLYLFHVSRQGVLTQLAIGGGVAAKAAQESIKYFGA